jgi:hypothetical protein
MSCFTETPPLKTCVDPLARAELLLEQIPSALRLFFLEEAQPDVHLGQKLFRGQLVVLARDYILQSRIAISSEPASPRVGYHLLFTTRSPTTQVIQGMKTGDMLPPEELSLFQKLHSHLMAYTAQQTGVDTEVRSADDFIELSAEGKMKIRDRFLKDVSLLDRYVQSNPFGFSPEEMEIASSWKHYVSATFFLVRITRDGGVFLEEKVRMLRRTWSRHLPSLLKRYCPFVRR